MNKLLLALLLTSTTAFAGGYRAPSIAEQNERMRIEGAERMRQTQEWAYQQNMLQLQQEQNRIMQQQADDNYFNQQQQQQQNRNNNRDSKCLTYYC